ncbi:MAG: hypothetical protein QXR30_03925 [Candidatus Woesearchaeota archaeon]
MLIDFCCVFANNLNNNSISYKFDLLKHTISVYRKIEYSVTEFKRNNFLTYFLTKNNDQKFVSTSKELNIFIIGECFSRLDSSYFKVSKKLNVEDVKKIYTEKKDKFISEIKGNFQIILIESDEIKIFNSRSGVSPFYYYFDKNYFVCGTAIYLFPDEIKSKLKISNSNILEYALFNYPLGENTLFENVYNLLPGEKLSYSDGNLRREIYSDILDFITTERVTKDYAINYGVELFNKVVNALVCDKEKIVASLTGGFDGRAILSALKIPKENLLLYSFGIKGSLNVAIPLKISQELGYNFKPFYLESEYSAAYPDYAINTCLLTDCLATVQRANYLYVFEDLANFSDIVITGIFGSELMRTFQNAGLMISETAVKVLKSGEPIKTLENEIDNYNFRKFWGEYVFNKENKEKVIESFRNKYLNRKYDFLNQFIFNYFIKDALRKYFGGEVHAERIFASNRFPFFDDEFVEFIVKSPFSAINNTFMEPTVKEKLNSQIFYAYILKRNNPELLKYKTDHGFAPKYLLYPFSSLLVGGQAFLWGRIRNWKNYQEFKPNEWFKNLLTKKEGLLKKNIFTDSQIFLDYLYNENLKNSLPEMKKIFSINLIHAFYQNELFH